jgi:hypothetical protein
VKEEGKLTVIGEEYQYQFDVHSIFLNQVFSDYRERMFSVVIIFFH